MYCKVYHGLMLIVSSKIINTLFIQFFTLHFTQYIVQLCNVHFCDCGLNKPQAHLGQKISYLTSSSFILFKCFQNLCSVKPVCVLSGCVFLKGAYKSSYVQILAVCVQNPGKLKL